MRYQLTVLTGFLVALLPAQIANANPGAPLTERALLYRCYAHLTGQRLAKSSSLWQQLTTKNAIQICSDLLNDVSLNAQGTLSSDSAMNRDILEQFHDLHKSWLPSTLLNTIKYDENLSGTIDIQDSTEPALFITRSLFTSNSHYKMALRGRDKLMALRDPDRATTAGSNSGFKRASRIYYGAFDADTYANFNTFSAAYLLQPVEGPGVTSYPYRTFPSPLVQVGKLYGLKSQMEPSLSPVLWTEGTVSTRRLHTEATPNDLSLPHEMHTNYGGGAIGTQSFLLESFGHGLDYRANGTTKLPRKWTEAVYKTFLCRSGPYVRAEDVTGFIAGANAAPFRQAAACLRCHVSLDQAALAARKLTPAVPGIAFTSSARTSLTITEYQGSESGSQGLWPTLPDDRVRHQAPQGRLMFRSFNGVLIDTYVNGLDELGTAISNTDDYYTCVAKRYVDYFLGIDIPLYDGGDSSNQRLLDVDVGSTKELKEFIIDLGKELRQSGSLKTTIKRIIRSDFYRSSSFGKQVEN